MNENTCPMVSSRFGPSAPERLMRNGRAHKIIKADETNNDKNGFKNMADGRAELKQAAQGPAGRPGSADEFGSDENRQSDQRSRISPVDRLLIGHGRDLVCGRSSKP